jgi:hypothetical protein
VTNCSARGGVLGTEYVGGLVGRNSGKIIGSDSSGSVSGENYIGGLVGNHHSNTIRNCYSIGDVTGNTGIGGIAGRNHNTIINCYSLGGISGTTNVGGLVGENGLKISSFNIPGTIINCYSAGNVGGDIFSGGLVGTNSSGEITASFWDIETSGQQTSSDGIGKTTAEMKMANTFLDAGWDFAAERENGIEENWSICEGQDYPKLALQFLSGDFNGDRKVTFVDFAVFSSLWLQNDNSYFWCRGSDLTNDGKVDFSDLEEFAENWLEEGIWTPMTTHYIMIDDFESYNDLDSIDPESNRIYDKWLDGYDNSSTNGALVGHAYPPFAERNIVHGGRQSMPYSYSTFFKYSKAELHFSPAQDLIAEGAEIISLYFRGEESNAAVPMGFIINNSSVIYHDNPNATQIDTWTEWIIELDSFPDVDLSNVKSIAICFGDENNLQAGGSGVMYFDDIVLYRP